MPDQSDAGPNSWTVQVVDGKGGTNSATLNIQVLAVLLGYNAWTNAYGMHGDLAIATNDYDADGVKNLWEYGADGNPTNPSLQGILPLMKIVRENGSNWCEYVYIQRTNENHGLSYTVLQTQNLVDQPWSNSVDAVIVGTGPAANIDFMTVTNRIPVEGKNQEFLRLKIQQQ
jgi:hypothetical protein